MSPLKVVLIVVFVGVSAAGSAKPTAKDQVIGKTRKLITDFPTVEQTTKIWDKLALDAYNMKTIEEMAKGIVNTVLGSLSGKQLVKGMQTYNKLVREFDGDIGSVIDRVATVASNSLQPLLDIMQIKVKTMTANDRSKAECIHQEYAMANAYLTPDLVKAIMTRLKAKMTDSEWAALKKSLGSVIFFDKYGV